MRFGAKLVQSVQKISQDIAKGLQKQVSVLFRKARPKIERDIKRLINNAIRSEPEYNALKSGRLRLEIGIPDVAVVDEIVDLFTESIKFNIDQVLVSSKGINATLAFTIIGAEDLNRIINSNSAKFVTEKGQTIPWLEWLLLRGADEIVLENKVLFKPSPASRTGKAIMIPSKSGGWRMPSRYVGTEQNNWITRAISTIESEILNSMKKYIEKG